jgi:O-antigen biosynthesis protein WbqP
MMKRIFDLILAVTVTAVLFIPAMIIALLVSLTSDGPVLYWSERVGLNNRMFRMPKFRTMTIHTPVIATHLIQNPDDYITPIGRFLRKSSLDEIPQLYNIVKGDMSFVGPRPALFNQYDLIELRTTKGIHKIMPGLTGWAQINGRDELPIPIKVEHDEFYKNNISFLFDLKILFKTVLKVLNKEGVTH